MKWLTLTLICLLTIVNIGCGGSGDAEPIEPVNPDDPGRCYLLVAMWFITGDRGEAYNWWMQEREDWPYVGHVLPAYYHYADEDCKDQVVYEIQAPTQAELDAHMQAGNLVAIRYPTTPEMHHIRWMEYAEDISAIGVNWAFICEY